MRKRLPGRAPRPQEHVVRDWAEGDALARKMAEKGYAAFVFHDESAGVRKVVVVGRKREDNTQTAP